MTLDFTYKIALRGFDYIIIDRTWNGTDVLTMEINSQVTNADLIAVDDIMWLDNETDVAFIVERIEEVLKGSTVSYTVKAVGLNALLKDFVTVPPDLKTDTQTGTREQVVRAWVENNCITRLNQYPIVLGEEQGYGDEITESSRYKSLYDEVQRVLGAENLAYCFNIDLTNKELVFNVLSGKDRTVNAPTYEPRVIFGLEYGNMQDYQSVVDGSASKNKIFVGGQGELEARQIIVVDKATTRKKEVFVDARDVEEETRVGKERITGYFIIISKCFFIFCN